MLICCHRGYHADVRENTLAAFEQAVVRGCDGIETDVRVCSDGRAVLFHNRITPDGRAVSSLGHQELCDAVGYYVPTLDNALERWDGVLWILEIKQQEAVPATLEAVRRFAGSRQLLVISFWHDVVEQILQQVAVDCGVLVWHQPATDASFLASLPQPTERLHTIVWNYEFAGDARLHEAGSRGYQNFVFGPESSAEHQRCAQLGLAGVITDYPELLLPSASSATDLTNAVPQT